MKINHQKKGRKLDQRLGKLKFTSFIYLIVVSQPSEDGCVGYHGYVGYRLFNDLFSSSSDSGRRNQQLKWGFFCWWFFVCVVTFVCFVFVIFSISVWWLQRFKAWTYTGCPSQVQPINQLCIIRVHFSCLKFKSYVLNLQLLKSCRQESLLLEYIVFPFGLKQWDQNWDTCPKIEPQMLERCVWVPSPALLMENIVWVADAAENVADITLFQRIWIVAASTWQKCKEPAGRCFGCRQRRSWQQKSIGYLLWNCQECAQTVATCNRPCSSENVPQGVCFMDCLLLP